MAVTHLYTHVDRNCPVPLAADRVKQHEGLDPTGITARVIQVIASHELNF